MKHDTAGIPVPDNYAPVPLVLLALELGEDADRLGWRLGGTTPDANGLRCIPADLARREIAAKRYADQTAQRSRELAAAAQAEQGARADAERDQMLARIDRLNQQFPADPLGPAIAVFAMAEAEAEAIDQQPLLAELAERERTTRRYDAAGDLVAGQ